VKTNPTILLKTEKVQKHVTISTVENVKQYGD